MERYLSCAWSSSAITITLWNTTVKHHFEAILDFTYLKKKENNMTPLPLQNRNLIFFTKMFSDILNHNKFRMFLASVET
jgi:hypothetical protein